METCFSSHIIGSIGICKEHSLISETNTYFVIHKLNFFLLCQFFVYKILENCGKCPLWVLTATNSESLFYSNSQNLKNINFTVIFDKERHQGHTVTQAKYLPVNFVPCGRSVRWIIVAVLVDFWVLANCDGTDSLIIVILQSYLFTFTYSNVCTHMCCRETDSVGASVAMWTLRPDPCGEEEAEPKGKAFTLPLNQHYNPHLLVMSFE